MGRRPTAATRHLTPVEVKQKSKSLTLETKNNKRSKIGDSVLIGLFINSNFVYDAAYPTHPHPPSQHST